MDKLCTGLEKLYKGLEKMYAGLEKEYTGLEKLYKGLEKLYTGLEKQYTGLEKLLTGLKKKSIHPVDYILAPNVCTQASGLICDSMYRLTVRVHVKLNSSFGII